VADAGKGGRILLSTTGRHPMSGWRRCSAPSTPSTSSQPGGSPVSRRRRQLRPADRLARPRQLDGLRLCSQARSLERTRAVPILAIADADNNARLLRGLEIGVNDYLLRPVDKNNCWPRAHPDPQRRYTDHLRDNVQNSIEAGSRRADRAA